MTAGFFSQIDRGTLGIALCSLVLNFLFLGSCRSHDVISHYLVCVAAFRFRISFEGFGPVLDIQPFYDLCDSVPTKRLRFPR